MEHYTKIKCPHCGGENISKNGIEKGVQRYRCNNSECKKGFRENYVNKGCNPEINKQIDAKNNVLKNAPHTQWVITANDWNRPYSRQDAAFPLEWVKTNKFWPTVSRVNNTHGDRNLICTCEPIESYMENN